MQTFLPFESTRASLACLDRGRLGKQRLEAFQLLVAIDDEWAIAERTRRTGKSDRTKGWRNHPAAVMWRRYPAALREYYNLAIAEWIKRGKNNTLEFAPVPDIVELPHWLGDSQVHASHRSRLLFKGKTDLLAERIKRYSGERGTKAWLKAHDYKEINTFREQEYRAVSSLLDSLGAEATTDSNYYLQYNWTEPDNLEYIWPAEDNSGIV